MAVGPIIFDLEGPKLSDEEYEILQHPLIGGVIFFTRNYESPEQLQDLCRCIRSASKKPLLLTVDQEGGRIQRFIPGLTRLPAMKFLGEYFQHHPQDALELTQVTGWLLAFELLNLGLDLSFTPVLDLQKDISSVITDRAFHADTVVVCKLAKVLIEGMHAAGMSAVGKHFPGHGSVKPDSHLTLPVDERNLIEIENDDMQPFQQLIQSNYLQGVMASHILFPAVDDQAVGFSPFWLQDILRKKLNFAGMIFSDDLSMEGANYIGDFPQRAQAALNAGCNMILICNRRHQVIRTLDQLPQQTVDISKFKIMQGHAKEKISHFKNSHEWKVKKNIYEKLFYKYEQNYLMGG